LRRSALPAAAGPSKREPAATERPTVAVALPVCCETTVTPFWRVEVLTPSAIGVNSIACGVSGNSSTIADMLESERETTCE